MGSGHKFLQLRIGSSPTNQQKMKDNGNKTYKDMV